MSAATMDHFPQSDVPRDKNLAAVYTLVHVGGRFRCNYTFCMSGTSTRRLRELLRQAEVKTAFDEDDLKQIVSSASEGSSSGRDRSSVLTPSTLGMSASGDLGISPGDDNGSEVSRLSIPSSLLDELHSTPRIGTKTSSRTPQSIMKTPNLDFSRVPDVGAGVHR